MTTQEEQDIYNEFNELPNEELEAIIDTYNKTIEMLRQYKREKKQSKNDKEKSKILNEKIKETKIDIGTLTMTSKIAISILNKREHENEQRENEQREYEGREYEKRENYYEDLKNPLQPSPKSIIASKDLEVIDEINLYFENVYNMYLNHFSQENLYDELKKYNTVSLLEIQQINYKSIDDYEKLLDNKAKMDMRRGRKPKEYVDIMKYIKKYEKTYNFIKSVSPIIERILKTDKGKNRGLK